MSKLYDLGQSQCAQVCALEQASMSASKRADDTICRHAGAQAQLMLRTAGSEELHAEAVQAVKLT